MSLETEGAANEIATEIVGGAADLDDVEAGGEFRQRRVGGEERAGGADDARALAVRDARRRAAERVRRAIADLDDGEHFAVEGDEVEFAAPGAEIGREDVVAEAADVA